MTLLKEKLTDGISCFVRNFVRVRQIFWGWYVGIYCTLDVAQGYQAYAKRSEEGQGSVSGQIRGSTGGSTDQAGRDDRGAERNEFRIREKEKQYLEKQREIKGLQNQIEEYIIEQYVGGEVDKLPMSVGMTQRVPDNVFLKLLHVDEHFDVFMCEGDTGSKLYKHSHEQAQYIKVLSGEILVTIDGKPYQVPVGEEISIHSNQQHEVEFVRDSKFLMVYHPPMSYNPLKFNFSSVN